MDFKSGKKVTPPKKTPRGHESGIKEEDSVNSEDQEKRGYYYDDAHGYEIYQPKPEEEEGPGSVPPKSNPE